MLKYALALNGEPSVLTAGTKWMLLLCVENLDSQLLVGQARTTLVYLGSPQEFKGCMIATGISILCSTCG